MFKKYLIPVLKVIGVLLLFSLFSAILGRLTSIFLTNVLHINNFEMAQYIGRLVIVLAFMLLLIKKGKMTLIDAGLDFSFKWYKPLLKGSVEGIAFAAAGLVILILAGMCKIDGLNGYGVLFVLKTLLIGIFKYLFLIALAQELLLRGYIFSMLKSKFTTAGAVLITSFFFSTSYAFSSNSNQLLFFNMFLLGILLNLVMIRDSSLFTSIGFNFGLNYIFGTIASSTIIKDGTIGLFNISLKGSDIITGGGSGIESGLLFTIMLFITTLYVLFSRSFNSEILAGFKRWKSIAMVLITSVVTIIYIITDISVWTPRNLITDNSIINVINEYDSSNNYTMKLKLDTNKKRVDGVQTLSYINNSSMPLNEIYMHIYPNAFIKYDGGIDIKTIRIDGTDREFKIEGQDQTLLYVPFSSQLKPGERTEIYMEYSVKIPKKSNEGFADRFAYGDDTFNLGNFFPIASVFEADGWDKHPYDTKGDAFYSETSNFKVEIEAPKSQIIAASGVIEDKVQSGKNIIWKIKANSVRDFAFVSSSAFVVEEGVIDGTMVKSYASSKLKAKYALEVGQHSISIFNEELGKYPYPTLSIVQADIGGGMEYPNLVMITSGVYKNIKLFDIINMVFYGKYNGQLEDVIAHEIGHQWWYGIVGNDEYREAWVDEPMTNYASLTYFKYRYGENAFYRVYLGTIAYIGNTLKNYNSSIQHLMRRPLNEFNDMEYQKIIYIKGTIMFYDLYKTIGEEKFHLFQRSLYDRYKFKILRGNELINAASEAAGEDMSGFFNKWLDTSYMGQDDLYLMN